MMECELVFAGQQLTEPTLATRAHKIIPKLRLTYCRQAARRSRLRSIISAFGEPWSHQVCGFR